jgi:transcriptional regulator with XRE-family HTH domain
LSGLRDPAAMNTRRVGANLREIRRHRRWTLATAASRAGISSAVGSRIVNGRFDLCSLVSVEAYGRALGADVDMRVRWQGGDLDRLMNWRHSAMHERMAASWKDFPEWRAEPEVSFSIYGERGIIDWFGWHEPTATVLIEELKSELVDAQELVGTNDRRMRLAAEIAHQRGWTPQTIASWVLLEDGRTNRRHLAQHASFLRTAFPADGRSIVPWLRNPVGAIRCLSFLPNVQPTKREGGRRAPT